VPPHPFHLSNRRLGHDSSVILAQSKEVSEPCNKWMLFVQEEQKLVKIQSTPPPTEVRVSAAHYVTLEACRALEKLFMQVRPTPLHATWYRQRMLGELPFKTSRIDALVGGCLFGCILVPVQNPKSKNGNHTCLQFRMQKNTLCFCPEQGRRLAKEQGFILEESERNSRA